MSVETVVTRTDCECSCASVYEEPGPLIILHCPVGLSEESCVGVLEAGHLRAAKLATSLLGYG